MTGFLDGGVIEEGGGYQIQRSLRLRASATAYLNRTTPASGGNRDQSWGYVGFKRGTIGVLQYLHGADTAAADALYLDANDKLCFDVAGTNRLISTQVFRDPIAHGIFMWGFDAANGTAASKLRIYYSGNAASTFAEITSWATDTRSGITTGTAKTMHNSVAHFIGKNPTAANGWADGYVSEHRVGTWTGSPPTPANFGGVSAITGVWAPSGTSAAYGTSGSYADFSDPTSATTLCYDRSGNGNNWTPNNISTTAGATYDSMLDVPLGGGGAERGNYCTLNPLAKASSTLSEGNLNATVSGMTLGTISTASGKWYWEVLVTSDPSPGSFIGVADADDATKYLFYYAYSGSRYIAGVQTGYGATYGATDTIGIALDADAKTVTFYKNNVSQGVLALSLIGTTSGNWVPATNNGSTPQTIACTFGQRPFTYTPPTGFKALHTGNLPTPTGAALEPKKHFDVVTYLGNGGAKAITGVQFQPDLVWPKDRGVALNHRLVDSVRGTTKVLSSNTTDAERTIPDANDTFTSFDSGGFTLGAGQGMNSNGDSYVAWLWKAGGAAVTNNAGSISSQVSANVAAGFSIVTYTADGVSGRTIGHGQGAALDLVMIKARTGVASSWVVGQSATGWANRLYLESTAAQVSDNTAWLSTAPSSSVITLGGFAGLNAGGTQYVACCARSIPGYSKIGSWTNNNSADGTFVYCGFRPRWIMLKNYDNSEAWYEFDSARQGYNIAPAASSWLQPNTASAEGGWAATATIDLVANGFKIRTTNPASGEVSFGTRSYVFYAIAEAPFKYALGR
jgi:hypothetical protein